MTSTRQKPAPRRAQPPRAPEPDTSPSTLREQAALRSRSNAGLTQERFQQARGLAFLAVLALVFSFWRAGFGNTFVHRWWWPF